jgi:hypothetical protein
MPIDEALATAPDVFFLTGLSDAMRECDLVVALTHYRTWQNAKAKASKSPIRCLLAANMV